MQTRLLDHLNGNQGATELGIPSKKLPQPIMKTIFLLSSIALCTLLSAHAQPPTFEPTLQLISTDEEARTAILEGRMPAGYRHVVLEESHNLGATWKPMISGPLTGAPATVTFRCPASSTRSFFRIRTGSDTTVPEADSSGPEMLSVVYDDAAEFISSLDETTHVLNRLAYGASPEDFLHVTTIGASAYIDEQLTPEALPADSEDPVFQEAFESLVFATPPDSGLSLIPPFSETRYFKGTSEPPVDWIDSSFDDASWESGHTPIGYGDQSFPTILEDMRATEDPPNDGYPSLFIRQKFTIENLAEIERLALDLQFDDGFVAYLNGTEIARDNIEGARPTASTLTEHGGRSATDGGRIIDISEHISLLANGENVLAIQGHNDAINNKLFVLAPSLTANFATKITPIASVQKLKHLLHLRGVHSRRQLQAVLAEFWENHFTTDYDKVQDYIEGQNEYRQIRLQSELDDIRNTQQSKFEAATIELREYEFFYENALGYFGDLLLYSATSPSMLIYLDSVENVAGEPNENYAREIFELSAFGVDNRYTQEDIVELAKCFTGWTVRKIHPDDLPPFPQSALDPLTTDTTDVAALTFITDLGSPWSYRKGTSEPASNWNQPGFAETTSAGWLEGLAGFGFENDPNDTNALRNLVTILPDMRQTRRNPEGFASLYLRKTLTLPDTSGTTDEIAVDITYDDGFIFYLNGHEIDRSRSMETNNERPSFDALSNRSHEHNQGIHRVSLSTSEHYIPGGTNTLAIQAHQNQITSNDFSILPRVIHIIYTTDSIDPLSTDGVYTFRFDPSQHDTTAKTLFPGTEYQINIPEGRTGPEGIRDALDVIDSIIGHPSTAEFISIKLVNKFVSDGISLDTYHARSAPDSLLGLVDQCVQAWTSTPRPGHIPTILRTIFDPDFKASPFWSQSAHLAKAKTPIEFANSAIRALGGSATRTTRTYLVPERQGMAFFTRDDPDGWSELGIDWINTLGFLERMRFAQDLGDNSFGSFASWPAADFALLPESQTPDALIAHFDTLIFAGTLSPETKARLKTFANTLYTEQDDGTITSEPSPYEALRSSSRRARLRETVGLILSLPEFHLQ